MARGVAPIGPRRRAAPPRPPAPPSAGRAGAVCSSAICRERGRTHAARRRPNGGSVISFSARNSMHTAETAAVRLGGAPAAGTSPAQPARLERRFKGRREGGIATAHSALSEGECGDQWRPRLDRDLGESESFPEEYHLGPRLHPEALGHPPRNEHDAGAGAYQPEDILPVDGLEAQARPHVADDGDPNRSEMAVSGGEDGKGGRADGGAGSRAMKAAHSSRHR